MWLNDQLFGIELLIRFTVRGSGTFVSLCVNASFLFGFENGMWDLIVFSPDHCLSVYITYTDQNI